MSPSPSSSQGVALVGYRGTGKNTVGRLLAERTGRRFVDADRRFVESVGLSIGEFFARHGEAAFRDREEEILRAAIDPPDSVLATGGGVVLRAANRALLREFGCVVWLSAEPADIIERLRHDAEGMRDRPALTAAGTFAEVEDVLRLRSPLYREIADLTVDTTARTPDQVVDEIVRALTRLEARRPERDHVVG
jgi:shikimate kinase